MHTHTFFFTVVPPKNPRAIQTPVGDFVGEGFEGIGDAVSVAKVHASTNPAIQCFTVEDGKGQELERWLLVDGKWQRDDT
jgi:hypothetical protein